MGLSVSSIRIIINTADSAFWWPDLQQQYEQHYAYDELGNLLQLIHLGGASERFRQTFGYARNRLTSIKNGSGTERGSFAYDEMGNQTSKAGNDVQAYDAANQLKYYSRNSVDEWYVYNASGQRVKKITHRGTYKQYMTYIDGVFTFTRIEEPGQDGGKQTVYIDIMGPDGALAEYRVGDQVIQRDSNIRVIYILKDHLGSCGHKLLENNGLWRYEETTPFGQTVMSGYRLNTQQKKFVGKEQDESGLYHMGARMYDSWQCRFVSVDPLWREYPYYTPYQYAGNRHINYIDLDGLEPAEPPTATETGPDPPQTGNRDRSEFSELPTFSLPEDNIAVTPVDAYSDIQQSIDMQNRPLSDEGGSLNEDTQPGGIPFTGGASGGPEPSRVRAEHTEQEEDLTTFLQAIPGVAPKNQNFNLLNPSRSRPGSPTQGFTPSENKGVLNQSPNTSPSSPENTSSQLDGYNPDHSIWSGAFRGEIDMNLNLKSYEQLPEQMKRELRDTSLVWMQRGDVLELRVETPYFSSQEVRTFTITPELKDTLNIRNIIRYQPHINSHFRNRR